MSQKNQNGNQPAQNLPKNSPHKAPNMSPTEQKLRYPLMESAAETLTAASGRSLNSVSLEAAAAGEVDASDLQISASTLRAQAALAEQAGYRELAQNLQRAAELTAVPNQELLRMYELMRPGRSTYAELTEMADRLENEFSAPITAAFVREATEVYRSRNLLRRT